MWYLIIGTILSIVLTIAAFAYSENGYQGRHFLAICFGTLTALSSVGGTVASVVCGYSWAASQVQADLLNREYGTNYTREEVFYASNVIDIIRELDRNRYEVNGDLRRERDPQRDKYQQK